MCKRIFIFLLIFSLLCTAGCGEKAVPAGVSSVPVSSTAPVSQPQPEPEPAVELFANPLTGVKELQEGELNKRPVAVMINNISVAQDVQCGLNDADIVYECLVEGGISRLMAVFYDIEKAGQIGTIRSARYTYVQLCEGMDALYVHHGSDMVYTQPYMYEIGLDRYEISTSNGGFREDNGHSYEHTLYTSGQKLAEGLKQREKRLENEEATKAVFPFGDEAAPVVPGTPCSRVTYSMSGSNTTTFAYDEATGKYTRMPSGELHKDYKSGQATVADNVFILYASSPLFEDGYHLRTILDSGEGLYVSKGGCQEIKWEKGDADDPLTFTDMEGNPLTVNAGTSWIAFAAKNLKSKTVVE